MANKYMVIDIALCSDCNNCFLACKDEHVANDWPGYTAPQPRHGHRWMNIHRRERGEFPRIDVAYLPQPCMHCADAPCIRAYPDCFSRREDGIVMIDAGAAKGRPEVLSSCPYGAIYWNEELKAPQKCTMCAHLLDDGWAMPRCAHSCPTGAIRFYEKSPEEMDEIIRAEKLECYQPGFSASPSVFYKNLHRFETDFITGALERDGECLEGAAVALLGEKGDLEQQTDFIGEFKFDGLSPGEYALTWQGKELARVHLERGRSVNLGNIELS